MIYLDNGATSYPKPPEVIRTITGVMNNCCANPGRAGHSMATKMAEKIFESRDSLAKLFAIDDPGQIIFTKNCTEALNMAIKGILHPGDHVITTSMEHNSVLRPLYCMEKIGVEVTIVRADREGKIGEDDIRNAVKQNTRMIIVTAASNVVGTKMPLEEIGRIALRKGILFMVDGAQGAGHMPIDIKKQHIDVLAVPGHKGLLGPQGTGFLYIREGVALAHMMEGGTGNRSKDKEQPIEFPDGYEAGTVNGPGIIALGEAARFIDKIGVDVIDAYERNITERLWHGLAKIPGVTLYGTKDPYGRTAVVAMNVDGVDCEEVAAVLNDKYEIAVRAGFHCSGMAHETIGTGKIGCVRICPGIYTSERDIDMTINAVAEIVKNFRK